jgi:hypothetical protein
LPVPTGADSRATGAAYRSLLHAAPAGADSAQAPAGAPFGPAEAHYRRALDACLDGNAARSRAEAEASFDLAAGVISKAT